MMKRLEVPVALGICVFCFFTVWRVPRLLRIPEKHFHLLPDFAKIHPKKHHQTSFAPITQDVPTSTIGYTISYGLWRNKHNIVHVINTRFMIHQHDLYNLGHARLNLFNTFTMPSLRQQTNHEFLWIIWTDARLRGKVLLELTEQISSLPNACLVGTEQKDESDFRDLSGMEKSELEYAFIAGNRQMLLDYYEASQTRLLIETSLDADDALSKNFVESVQRHVVDTMGSSSDEKKKIEVFCPERHIEWRYYRPNDEDHWKGHLIQFHNKNFCINSGLSIAYHVEATGRQLRGVNQCNIQKQLSECQPRPESRKIIPPEQEMCSGQGTETVVTVVPEKQPQKGLELLNQQKKNNHRESSCPEGSFMCHDPERNGREFGGPPFAIPADVVTCRVAKSSDLVQVEVVPSRYSPGEISQTSVELRMIGTKYMLAAVLMNASGSANVYTWDWKASTGGTKRGTFETPETKPIHHMEVCVIPAEKLCNTTALDVEDMKDVMEEELESDKELPFQSANADSAYATSRRDTECRRKLVMVNEDTLATARNYFQSAVLMPRTPAAAGMKHVIPKHSNYTSFNSVPEETFETEMSQEHAWTILEHDFGVDREEVVELRKSFEDNMEKILIDAVAGQCKHRFSCKESTKRALKNLLHEVQRRKNRR